jgi:hypothetical protein
MIYYHTTDTADQILRGGFRDATGSYMLHDFELTGVWLVDSPLDINEGCKGDQVLRVEFPAGVDLSSFELVVVDFEDADGVRREYTGYREWCVPAALINERATVRLMSADDEDDEDD